MDVATEPLVEPSPGFRHRLRRWTASQFPWATPAVLLLILGVIGPLLIMIGYMFGFLGRDPVGLEHFTEVVTDSFTRGVLINTIRLALTVTLVTLVIGYPMAWIIARSSGWRRVALLALIIAPLLTNPVVRTMGWMVILSPRGVLNNAITSLVGGEGIDLFGNLAGVTVALSHVFLPFMILPMLNTIEAIPRSVREASAVHGAHPIIGFFRVLLPMSIRGIVAGSTLVFLLAAGSLVTPALIGAKRVWVLSTLIYQRTALGSWGEASALALWLFMLALLAVLLSNRLGERVAGARNRGTRGPVRRALHGSLVTLGRRMRSLPRFVTLGKTLRVLYLLAFIGFMLFPLGMVVKSAFDSHEALHAGFDGFTLRHFTEAIESGRWMDSFLLSLRMALIAVLFGFLFAIPASYAIARGSFPGRQALLGFLLSPLAVPRLVLGLAFLLLFNELAIRPGFTRLMATHVIIVLPFIVRTLVTALHDITPSWEESARTLGATQLTVFRRIIFPMIKPAMLSAGIFAFLVSFDESALTVLISGTREVPLAVRMFGELFNDWTPQVAAISTMLIGMSIVVLIVIARFVGLSSWVGRQQE